MRLLLDQDVYFATERFLREHGHDVVTAAEIGCSRSLDAELLRRARKLRRIFVTRDRDFGRLVFLDRHRSGIIYLRISFKTLADGHQELRHVLEEYSEKELGRAFVVVEVGRHRIRRL